MPTKPESKKTDDTAPKKGQRLYSFPAHSVTIYASSLKEAQSKLTDKLKGDKADE